MVLGETLTTVVLVPMAEDREETPPLATSDEAVMLRQWGQGPEATLDPSPLYQVFERNEAAFPQTVAAIFEGKSLTYGELNARANQLARALNAKGVCANTMVASFLEPCLEVPVALLAIHKAGGVYVPLDPTHPDARIRDILQDVCPQVVLTQRHLTERLSAQTACELICVDDDQAFSPYDTTNLAHAAEPSDLAYVIYTSGTTGKPKGVLATHANLSHYIRVAEKNFGVTAADRMPVVARFTFSITMFELWTPLVTGAQMHLLPRALILDFDGMVKMLGRVTMIQCTASLMRNLLNYIDAQGIPPSQFAHLRHTSCGGDFVLVDVQERMKKAFPNAEVYVLYGCSENSVMAATYLVPRSEVVTLPAVGRPMVNSKIRLLDAKLQMVAPGAKGEIFLGGKGINRGYLNQPELTVEKFVEIEGERYYRTGDWGRLNPHNNLELLGRTDFQLKLRGVRMEPLEIETILRQAPGVKEALVAVHPWQNNPEGSLTAYLVLANTRDPALPQIRQHLELRLPEYMVPRLFVALNALPVNLNGKVDRKALPPPTADNVLRSGEDSVPQTLTEKTLARIWEETLHISPVGLESNFFELGGDSMAGVLMGLEIEREFSQRMGLEIPFQYPRLRDMASWLDRPKQSEFFSEGVLALRASGSKPILFCVYGALLYRELSLSLGDDQPVYGLYLSDEIDVLRAVVGRPDADPVQEVPDRARRYIQIMRGIQPKGPYILAGESFGGILALEMAQQLKMMGEEVRLLVMMDSGAPNTKYSTTQPFKKRLKIHAILLRRHGLGHVADKVKLRAVRSWERISLRLLSVFKGLGLPVPRIVREHAGLLLQRVRRDVATRAYVPQKYSGKVLLFRALTRDPFEKDALKELGWGHLLSGLIVQDVPGDHLGILDSPNVEVLASYLRKHLGS